VLDDQQTIDQIVMRRGAVAALDAAEAQDVLDYVDRARVAGERVGGKAQGRRRVDAAVHELSLAMVLPVPTVERQIAMARRVRSVLPSVWQAWVDGRLSTQRVHAIDKAARRLVDAESVAALDLDAVDTAACMTVRQLSEWLDRWVEHTEPDASRARHEKAHADRGVRARALGDGMTRITADVAATDGAAVMQRLTGTAHALPAGDPRTLDQARADLMVDTLLGRRDGGLGYRAVIGITVPLSSLMGFSDQPGELSDRSATIPAQVVRAAMADPKSLLYRLVTDDIGNLMSVQWLGRCAPTKLDQILDFRDGTSVFPTSSVPARLCDDDHSEPWPAETSAANMGPVNRRAHRLKTEGLIGLRQPRPGTFEWITSTGHTYTRHPQPLPIADWGPTPAVTELPVDPWADEFEQMLAWLDAA